MPRVASPDWFVVYKGDEVIGIGTAYECARQLGLKVRQVWQLATPSRVARFDVPNPPEDQMIAVRVTPGDMA